MKIIRETISLNELKPMSEKMFDNLVKAVVDINKNIMAVDAELHADLERLLLEAGSKQTDLWGINLYLSLTGDDFIEFDSMINIRPYQNNRSRNVENPEIRERIIAVVNKLVKLA